MKRRPVRHGQHFLVDQGVLQRIVDIIQPDPSEWLVEIGPGKGVLTRALWEGGGGRMTVIEIDETLCTFLRGEDFSNNIEIIHDDALKIDWQTLVSKRHPRIVGNLPYNISAPLFLCLLPFTKAIGGLCFMVQKEVADRLVALPGTKAYSRLSVMVQCGFHVKKMFDVAASAFSPPPKVRSSFVTAFPRTDICLSKDLWKKLGWLLHKGFSARRKTIKNSLAGIISVDTMQRLGFDTDRRADDISIQEYLSVLEYTER